MYNLLFKEKHGKINYLGVIHVFIKIIIKT